MASDELFGLTADQCQRLVKILRRDELGQLNPRPRHRRKQLPFIQQSCFIARAGGSGIAARDGLEVFSADVTLYRLNDDNELESLGETKTAWNLSQSEVAADAFITIKLEDGSRRWIVDWEDCG